MSAFTDGFNTALIEMEEVIQMYVDRALISEETRAYLINIMATCHNLRLPEVE